MAKREGTIPTVLGTVVTATGVTMATMEVAPMIAAGVIGFGAAHIILGGIDIIQHKKIR